MLRDFAASFTSPMTSVEDTQKALAEAGKALWFVAALQAVVLTGVALFADGPVAASLVTSLADPAVFALGAYFLPRRRSRTLALTILLFALGALVSSSLNRFGGGGGGGKNVILGLILLGIAVSTVRATFAYHRLVQSRVCRGNVAIVSMLTPVYALVAVLVTSVAGVLAGLGDESLVALLGVLALPVFVAGFAGVLPFLRRRPFAVPAETAVETPMLVMPGA